MAMGNYATWRDGCDYIPKEVALAASHIKSRMNRTIKLDNIAVESDLGHFAGRRRSASAGRRSDGLWGVYLYDIGNEVLGGNLIHSRHFIIV
jgi:hypothetical protein